MNVSPPHAPWHLAGECIAGLVWGRHRSRLPDGIRPLPGPVVVLGVRYADSPVGPYVELAVGEPARLGVRPGLCITTMVVTSADSRVGGVSNWGFPKELGTLEWSPDGTGIELWWKERDLRVRSQPVGRLALPGFVPMRNVQRRSDGPVVVPGRVRGWARLARVEIDVPDPADPFAGLGGTHHGVQVRGVRLTVEAARHPAGLTSTLRAPLQAPEPALSRPVRGS